MSAKKLCLAGLVVYAVLSVTDFVQTYALIESSGGVVYEANPVAAGWLEQYGWGGLALFKAGAVAVVAGAIAVLARRRPKAGMGVAALACLSLVYVTLYSHQLVTAAELDPAPAAPEALPTEVRAVRIPPPIGGTDPAAPQATGVSLAS